MLNQITLKPRTREHVTIFWNQTQDKEIQHLFPISSASLEESLALFEQANGPEATSYGRVICVHGQYVGDVWCYNIDEAEEKMAMLSILIFEKSMWRQGIGLKACQQFIPQVFARYHIDKIGAFSFADNTGSIRLMEKAGFTLLETFVEDERQSVYMELCRHPLDPEQTI